MPRSTKNQRKARPKKATLFEKCWGDNSEYGRMSKSRVSFEFQRKAIKRHPF